MFFSSTSVPSLVLALSLLTKSPATAAAADTPKTPTTPCTIHSSLTGSFDLRPLQLFPPVDPDSKSKQPGTHANESYHSRGYDYGRNFTINFCAPVVEDLKAAGGVEDLSRSHWTNVSAYYKESNGDIYSIGLVNQNLTARGKKLVLNYTGGSVCPDLDEDGEPIFRRSRTRSLIGLKEDDDEGRKGHGDEDLVGMLKSDDDDDGHVSTMKESKATRRKSTLMSFICDTSPSLTSRPAVSFLGTPDHCTYVFEVRSRWACAGSTTPTESGSLGPGGVFGVILGIAIAVYVVGGVVYQRNVMHQRGWRQLPNYAVWAGLFGFFQDMFIIIFSSCTRHMPSFARLFGGKAGYHQLGSDYRSNGSAGRGRTSEDANRLIDSLDEEWDS